MNAVVMAVGILVKLVTGIVKMVVGLVGRIVPGGK